MILKFLKTVEYFIFMNLREQSQSRLAVTVCVCIGMNMCVGREGGTP